MKRLIVRGLLALAVAAIAFVVLAVVPSVPKSEKEFEITDASVEIELQEDGSLLVHERLPFDFTGSFRGAYRDILENGDAQVRDVQVSEGGRDYEPGGNTVLGSFDLAGRFGTESFGGSSDFSGGASAGEQRYTRVVWHYRALDETKTFDITYRVTGATNVRDDVVDVTWAIWGKEWDFWLDHLDAEITAASGVAPTEAWVRPRSVGVEPEIEGDAATVSIDRIAEGKAVGMRAVFPREAITSTAGAEVDRGDGLEQIRDEEAKIDDEYSFLERAQNFAADNQVPIYVVLFVLGVGSIVALLLMARERPVDVPEYLSEPPEDVTPAIAYGLAREGEYDQRVVLASLLDLVDRGYYEARAAQDDELDLEIRRAPERPQGELEQHEVATLDFFDRLLGDEWVAVGKMKDQVPKHSTAWRSRWENLNEKLDEAETSFMSWDRDLTGWRAGLALLFGALGVAFGLLVWARTNILPVPVAGTIATVGLMLAPPNVMLKRMATGPRLRSARWRAFDRWTGDFPRLHDDPPATLKLWRRILVYAVAFGTAERIAKSGRIPAPVAEEAQSGGLWTGYAFYAGGFSSFNNFGSGFSSHVAPQSSSSGGSGFSGGGGGGFSGGGGGGAW